MLVECDPANLRAKPNLPNTKSVHDRSLEQLNKKSCPPWAAFRMIDAKAAMGQSSLLTISPPAIEAIALR
jgi:hypothetical protein